jgi:glycosyltransferase involved in cell wall biosynthesis
MTLNVYTIVWNEEFMLPHFLEHYNRYADKIFVIDHASTDLTPDIAIAHPRVVYSEADFKDYSENAVSYTLEEYAISNPSDWAVVVDCDELIHGLETLVNEPSGVLKTIGYMMIGKTGKLEDCKAVRMSTFDKPVVFDPKLRVEFGDGRHTCNRPTRPSKLKLLHYKYPSREYYYERNIKTYPRIMDKKTADYRIKRGLEWYDAHA